jgi:hypothetical protein
VLRIGMLGIDGHDLHARRCQKTLDVMHRRDQALSLLHSQWGKQRCRELVGALVKRGAFATMRLKRRTWSTIASEIA